MEINEYLFQLKTPTLSNLLVDEALRPISLYSSYSFSVFPLGRAAVGQRVTVWKLLPKHAFEAEFRDASSSSAHVPADVNQPTSPNPLRSTNRQAALTEAVRDVRLLSLLKDG